MSQYLNSQDCSRPKRAKKTPSALKDFLMTTPDESATSDYPPVPAPPPFKAVGEYLLFFLNQFAIPTLSYVQ